METHVKERLVGAAILVGLIVVLVPEMLSGPKDSEVDPAAGGDGALRTYTIDLNAPSPTPEKEAEPAAQNGLPLLPPAEVEALKKPLESPSVQAATSPEPKPGTAPASKPDTPPPPPPAPVTSTPPPSKASGGHWAVQIGSFAKPENAKRLVDELRAKGYPAFSVTSGSGANMRYKVRVGPQDTRAQADKMADRLKHDGRQVAVVSHP